MKTLKDYSSQELFDELWAREDVVAIKMWTREDLYRETLSRLEEEDHENGTSLIDHTDDIVDLAMLHGNYERLSDCTDDEWNLIVSNVIEAIDEYKEEHDGK